MKAAQRKNCHCLRLPTNLSIRRTLRI